MSLVIGGASGHPAVVPLPDLGPVEMVATMAASEAALVAMRPSIARFLALEPAVRLGEDAEAIHDMRVAARRIRTALRVFRGAVPSAAEAVRAELRWAASLLGDVRDLDVHRIWLAAALEDFPADERGVVHTIRELFGRQRDAAHARMIEGFDSVRFDRIRSEIVGLARRVAGPAEQPPIAQVAPALVEDPYRKMRKAGRRLGSDAPSAALHRLRLRCKRARYAIEFVSPLYGGAADPLISRLVRLQDLLGDLHDSEVAVDMWRDFETSRVESLPPGGSFVLGRLAERAAQRARKLRRRFPDRFRAARGRRWKELKQAMEARAAV